MLSFPTPVADAPLRIALHEGSRRELLPLFKLADDSAVAIGEYLDRGVVHVAAVGEMAVGHSQDQLLGFRLLRVDRDAYGPDHGSSGVLVANGIRVRDRVWLELEL